MKKFLQEFKEFAIHGNAIELAIGVILGTAFSKIVTSLVNDILMPPIGQLIGNVDFSELYVNLSRTRYSSLAEAQKAGAATINYGIFLDEAVHFLIVAVVIFLAIRPINRLKKR